MDVAEIEAMFPSLKGTDWLQTSKPDRSYNCIGWAGDSQAPRWWEPYPGYYWPTEPLPQWATIETLIKAFAAVGFEDGQHDASLEAGVEKVAIYAVGNEYMHAARQLENGHWTSKLGYEDDIRHETLDGLVGSEYGQVVRIMKRARR